MKDATRRRFDRAASTYDQCADFQDAVGQELLGWVSQAGPFSQILDLGCGTGTHAVSLQRMFPHATVIVSDGSPSMTERAFQKMAQAGFSSQGWVADAHSLPASDSMFDAVFANLLFQWLEDIEVVSRELNRSLRHEGLVFFSTLGPRTLYELHDSVRTLAPNSRHPLKLLSLSDLCFALQRGGLVVKKISQVERVWAYQDVMDLLQHLKGIGGLVSQSILYQGVGARPMLHELSKTYASRFRQNGTLPATYEIIMGIAVKYDR